MTILRFIYIRPRLLTLVRASLILNSTGPWYDFRSIFLGSNRSNVRGPVECCCICDYWIQSFTLAKWSCDCILTICVPAWFHSNVIPPTFALSKLTRPGKAEQAVMFCSSEKAILFFEIWLHPWFWEMYVVYSILWKCFSSVCKSTRAYFRRSSIRRNIHWSYIVDVIYTHGIENGFCNLCRSLVRWRFSYRVTMVSRFLMQSSSFVGVRMSAHTTGFINMFHQYQYHLWAAPLFCLIMPSHIFSAMRSWHDWSYYHIVCKAYAKPGGVG